MLENRRMSNPPTPKFWSDEGGTVAILFGLMIVPLILFAGLASDYSYFRRVKSDLQSATDAAAIAAASLATAGDQSNATRQAAALSFFQGNANNLENHDIQKSISFANRIVTVRATAKVKTFLSALIMPEVDIVASSSARFGTKDTAPLCLLALNPAAPEAFKAWGTADLIASDCAVQSRSTNSGGMVTGGTATATAAHFCSAGGHSGSGFTPAVEDNCDASNDPYAGKFSATAMVNAGVNVLAPCNTSTGNGPVDLKKQENIVIDAGGPTNAYVFCDFLKLGAGATVTFMPGVYVFTNYVEVSSGATLNAPEGVTFYFIDKNTYSGAKESNVPLTVQGGADFNLVAPQTGPLAGMAIVHPLASAYNGGTKPASTHTIIGGGSVNIVGTIYAPQAKILVTGNGTINDTSKYFSIAADFVELKGNGQLYIKAGVDIQATGLPPMPSIGGVPAMLVN